VRIAFHQTAIHKGTRIAFVTVADDIFLVGFLLQGQCPLFTRGKTAAAASSQTRRCNFFTHLLGCHLGISPASRLITAACDIFPDIFRINITAISQLNTFLLGIERNFFLCVTNLAVCRIHIQQALDLAFVNQRSLDNLRRIFSLDFDIQDAFRFNRDQRAHLAEALAAAAGEVHADLVAGQRCAVVAVIDNLQTRRTALAQQGLEHPQGAVRHAARAGTDDDAPNGALGHRITHFAPSSARMPSRTATALSGVIWPWTASSITSTGARPQAPRHDTVSTVTSRSGVVSWPSGSFRR